MRALMFVAVFLVVCIAGVGFYRGWFQLSTDTSDQKPSATITVDKDKIRADEKKAKEEMPDFGQKTKEQAGGPADKAREPEHQP
jgi:hypothetical protein